MSRWNKKIKRKTREEINRPYDNHSSGPVSRRQFLSRGFLSTSAMFFTPTLLTMLSKQAYADVVCNGIAGINSKTPVIMLDLSGGANIAGSNIIVGGAGGQSDYLTDYTSLGLPPDFHPSQPGQINSSMGLKFHSDSGFLRGINSVTNSTIRSRVDGGIFCASSADDTSNNPHSPLYWINKAGATGDLAALAGTSSTITGGNSLAPGASIDPALQPVRITSPTDCTSLVTAGYLNNMFATDKIHKILKATQRMSATELDTYNSLSIPDQIKELVKCGYVQTEDIVGKYSSSYLNPLADTDVLAAYNDFGNSDQAKAASIGKLVLDGHIGAATIQKGGYDYHTGDRQVGEIRDFEAGEMIGRLLKLAHHKGKDLLIYVYTDGGVFANPIVDNTPDGRGKYAWIGDSSQRSSSFMLLYRHAGRPTLNGSTRQIGHYGSTGAINLQSSLIGNSVTNLAKAFIANYMALHGEQANLADVVGDNPFGNNLDNYLLFNPIT